MAVQPVAARQSWARALGSSGWRGLLKKGPFSSLRQVMLLKAQQPSQMEPSRGRTVLATFCCQTRSTASANWKGTVPVTWKQWVRGE